MLLETLKKHEYVMGVLSTRVNAQDFSGGVASFLGALSVKVGMKP